MKKLEKTGDIATLDKCGQGACSFPTMKTLGGKGASDAPAEKAAEEAAPKAPEAPKAVAPENAETEPLFEDVKVKDCVAVKKSKKLLQFTLDDGTGRDRTILSGIHAFYEPEELIGKTLVAIVNLPPRQMMGVESCATRFRRARSCIKQLTAM